MKNPIEVASGLRSIRRTLNKRTDEIAAFRRDLESTHPEIFSLENYLRFRDDVAEMLEGIEKGDRSLASHLADVSRDIDALQKYR